jgi:predicted nuclease of predicted toxin-antitoxin system
MKLLFDQNLSWRLPQLLSEIYPGSRHIREFGLKESQDLDIWKHAKSNDFAIVTKDKDFQQRSWLQGHPPKVIHFAGWKLHGSNDRGFASKTFGNDPQIYYG